MIGSFLLSSFRMHSCHHELARLIVLKFPALKSLPTAGIWRGFAKAELQGKQKEDLILKFEDEKSTGLPCLPASSYKKIQIHIYLCYPETF